jgi:hypothetical protein
VTAPCPICADPRVGDIDRAIREQQAASRRGEATSAPSYSQIARTFDVPKPALYAHRDGCLTRDGATVRRTAAGTQGMDAPGIVGEFVDATGGSYVTRASESDGVGDATTSDAPARASSSDVGSVTASTVVGRTAPTDAPATLSNGVGQARPPERSRPNNRARARDLSIRERPYSKTAASSVEEAARRFAVVAHDIAITHPDVRANGSYIEEVAELVQAGEWEEERSVQVLVRKWNKSRLFVYQCFRDACTLIRIARGTPGEMRETSAARWMKIFKIASQSEDPAALRAATAALQGHDRALGIVDSGTKVQVNVMQDPGAQEMLRVVFDTVREDPAMLEKLRTKLRALAGSASELPAIDVEAAE